MSEASAEAHISGATESLVSCGVRVDLVPLRVAAAELALRRDLGAVHLCNAYTLSLAARDGRFQGVLNRGALNLPDGTPLVWIARRLGFREMTQRVYGPDLMAECLDIGRSHSSTHFLYGATPETLQLLEARIAERWPEAVVVGSESPPFREITDEEVVAAAGRMAESGASVVWVGLGTPKQDWMVDRLAAARPGTYVAIGAAFDFIAGTKRQAPAWVGRAGLEWLYRLACEPRRLWKRYLIGNTVFIWHNLCTRPVRG